MKSRVLGKDGVPLAAGFVLLALCLSFPRDAGANPITVNNASFETLPPGGLPILCAGTGCAYSEDPNDIPGWVPSDPTIIGQGPWQPGSNTLYFDTLPDGITVAFANGGTITQTVGATVLAGLTYTLQVDVGLRKDLPNGPVGTVELLIGNTPFSATGVVPSLGNWSMFTAEYIAAPGDIGKSITIQLSSAGIQGDFDNVRLSDSASTVPEPTSLTLLGTGVVGLIARRRKGRRSTEWS